MKRVLLTLSMLSVLFVPACRKRTPKKVRGITEEVAIVADQGEAVVAKGTLFLDESLEELDFSEEVAVAPTVTMRDDLSTAPLVAGDSLFESAANEQEALADQIWASRRVEQAKHGLHNIYFDLNRYRIRPSEKQKLADTVKAVKSLVDKGMSVVVEGHACCYGGSPAYNMMLSEKRAQIVAQEFIKNGIAEDRIKVVGRGNEMPVVMEQGKEQQAPNRRVEIYPLIEV